MTVADQKGELGNADVHLRTLPSWLAAALMLAACGPAARPNSASPHADHSPAPTPAPAADPLLMPQPLVDFMQGHGWGQMHLEWHTERRWDLLPPTAVAYAQRQGWHRAERQEGDPGNGVEFLAMHRAMLQLLVEHDPAAASYLAGWQTPPTDPHDRADPLPGGQMDAFDPDMLAALDRLEHHLDSFDSEDALGLYIETSMGAKDRTAGVHNYLHNRFQDPSSPIDVGNPAVNLMNQRFWRLHGWIDHLWAAYRAQAHLDDHDPKYVQLMQRSRDGMAMKMKGIGPVEAPPPELIEAVRPKAR